MSPCPLVTSVVGRPLGIDNFNVVFTSVPCPSPTTLQVRHDLGLFGSPMTPAPNAQGYNVMDPPAAGPIAPGALQSVFNIDGQNRHLRSLLPPPHPPPALSPLMLEELLCLREENERLGRERQQLVPTSSRSAGGRDTEQQVTTVESIRVSALDRIGLIGQTNAQGRLHIIAIT